MVGLVRDTCPAFKRDQRIRPKIIIFSVFGPRAGGGVLSNDPEQGRWKATNGSGREKKTFCPQSLAWTIGIANRLWD
jgi:hypothetical protein